MKKILLKFSLSIITAVSVCVLSVSAIKTHTPPKTPSTPATDTSSKSEHYVVKGINGKIGVFFENDTTPLYVLDGPYIRDLPEYDQKLLEQGIVADDNTELLKILEDYDY